MKVTSSFCSAGEGQCVAVEIDDDGAVIVTDTKDEDSEPLVFSPAEWDEFISGAKNGEFDRDALVAAGGKHYVEPAAV